MEALYQKGTANIPTIVLDQQNGIFKISGRSLVDDAAQQYKPVLEWIRDYSKNVNSSTELVFNLEYLNTASAKVFFDLFSILENTKGSRVTWYYPETNKAMLEAGQNFAELFKIPFEFKSY